MKTIKESVVPGNTALLFINWGFVPVSISLGNKGRICCCFLDKSNAAQQTGKEKHGIYLKNHDSGVYIFARQRKLSILYL
jgi:hypothetical protein